MNYPKDEKVWVSYRTENGELRFILTSKQQSRDVYFLYEVDGNSFKKLGKSKSPLELEEKFNVHDKLRS